jgi:type II secretory pathway component PulF
MATLLENGVVLLPALSVAKDTVGNRVYKDTIAKAEAQIEAGSTLAHELEQDGSFPDLVVHMVTIGEESGAPEQMLTKLAEYYDAEVRKTLERITGSLGPLVILVMGLIIGFIAVAMMLPIFDASSMIGG